jgi:hypothetical protein
MAWLIRPCVILALAATVALARNGAPAKPNPAAMAVAGPVLFVAPTRTIAEDPFPIQRIRATEQQIPQILKPSEASALVRLPRSDFEARVRAAGAVLAESRSPQLTHSRYRASLLGTDLVGTAEIDLNCNRLAPVFLPLEPVKLSCSHSTWADGKEAVLGVTNGNAANVWVNRTGAQTLKFEWSAAGALEFGERRFELRVPATLSTVLDLELPADLRPSAPGDVLLTGPFPGGDPAKAGWRFRFGGRSRLDFSIRPAVAGSTSASSNLNARYEISSGQVTGAFEFELRPAKGTVSEWLFTVDRGLRVVDVVVNNKLSWSLDGPAANGSRLLHVLLNQPGIGGKIQVLASAPIPDASKLGDSPLPMIRPVGAVLDDESLEIKVAPELKLEKWSPGDYRLVDGQFLVDQTQVLTLTGAYLPAGADRVVRQAPTLGTAAAEAVFSTAEQIDWRFERDRTVARFTLALQVLRNPLFRLPVRFPMEYAFVRASSPREDLIASASAVGNVATIEFARPLTAGQAAELILEFRGPRPSARQFAFPAFTPVGASGRSGVLGIAADSHWSIDCKPGVGMTPVGWLDFDTPGAPHGAMYSFRYGTSGAAGAITLSSIAPVFTAEQLREPGNGPAQFAVRVRSGDLPSVAAVESPTGAASRTWSVTAGEATVKGVGSKPMTEFVRQFGLIAPSGFVRLLNAPPQRTGNDDRLWIVQFAQPAAADFVLETQAKSTVGERSTTRFRFLGAQQSQAASSTSTANPQSQTPAATWSFADLYLVTIVQSGSEAEMIFGGFASSASLTHLPIQLPSGAVVCSTNIGGRWLSRDAQQLSPQGELALPLIPGEATRFEVRYRLPIEPGIASRIRSPAPVLPAAGAAIQCWWEFGSGVLPLLPAWGWWRGKPADAPSLLSPPPFSGSLGLVSPLAVEEVSVASVQTAAAFGIVLSAAMFLFAWVLFHTGRGRTATFIAAMLILAGAAFGPGGPWLQRAFFLPVCIALFLAAAAIVWRGRRKAIGVTAAAIVLGIVVSTTLAQPAAPAVVVLLPAEPDGLETVVAPKELLDRLEAITHSSLHAVVVTASDYSATFEETTARVTARFVAQSLGEPNESLALPLSDARLESVMVNGSPSYPTSQKPGLYLVPLAGAARYDMEVRFWVPLIKSATEREVKFGVPECPATRLTADLPGTARQIQCVGRLGKQVVLEGETKHVEVDVGAVKAVNLRWREGPAGAAAIKVREACIWDVSERGAELTACYLTRLEQGAVAALRYDLPAELEPVDVSLRPIEANGSAAIRDWSLGAEQGGMRQLRIDLQGPTTERLLVTLTCRLKKAITRQPTLRFPKPLAAGGVSATDAIYALRARELGKKSATEAVARVGLIEEPAETLTRDREWLRVLDRRLDAAAPLVVYRPATVGANPELRPILGVSSEKPSVALETNWQLEPHRAVASGAIHWSAKEAAALIEFTLAGVKILEVRGPEVGLWTQSGGRVQVWLRKAATDCDLDWSGVSTQNGQQKQAPGPIDVAAPHVLDAQLTTQTLRLRAVDGWSIKVERDRGWSFAASSGDKQVWQSNTMTVQPIRLSLAQTAVAAAPPTQREASPVSQATSAPAPAATQSKPSSVLANATEPSTPDSSNSDSLTPLLRLAAWVCALAALALLAVRFPRSSWPEQLALVGCLFGMTLVGAWWVLGLAVWIAARTAWLVEFSLRPRSSRDPNSQA